MTIRILSFQPVGSAVITYLIGVVSKLEDKMMPRCPFLPFGVSTQCWGFKLVWKSWTEFLECLSRESCVHTFWMFSAYSHILIFSAYYKHQQISPSKKKQVGTTINQLHVLKIGRVLIRTCLYCWQASYWTGIGFLKIWFRIWIRGR